MIRTIDPARDVNGRCTEHTAQERRADERPRIVNRDEVAEIVAIRQVHVGRRPRADKHMAIGLEQGKGVVPGEVRQPLAQKAAHGLGAEGHRQFVRRGDAKFGDTRLDVLEGAIDQLDIALGLLAEHDAKIAARDQVLLDGLPMQVPDGCAATEQDDDNERDADRPQVQCPNGSRSSRTQRRRTRPAPAGTPRPRTNGRSCAACDESG